MYTKILQAISILGAETFTLGLIGGFVMLWPTDCPKPTLVVSRKKTANYTTGKLIHNYAQREACRFLRLSLRSSKKRHMYKLQLARLVKSELDN